MNTNTRTVGENRKMLLEVVRRISYEKENSQLVSSKPRNELQRIRLHGLYELLVILRIVLVFNIQTGWIHQDEFSDSIEVVAGDYFDLQVFKSPSFNSSFPTHSVALIHATIYFPYFLCNSFLSYDHELGKERIPNSRLLILIPRLLYLVLSFLVDYLLIQFCKLNDETRLQRETSQAIRRLHLKLQKNQSKPQQEPSNCSTDVGKSSSSSNNHQTTTTTTTTTTFSKETLNSSDQQNTTIRRRKVRRRALREASIPEEEEEEEMSISEDRPNSSTAAATNTNNNPSNQSPPPPPNSSDPVDTIDNDDNNVESLNSSNNNNNNDHTIRLVTLASSQVVCVFATRTHPSSISLLLFASLLYLVSASFHAYDQYIPLLERYHQAPKADGVQKVLCLREMRRAGYTCVNRLPCIAFVVVLGLFNDPEFFISYACIPLFFYMQRGVSHRLVGMKYFHARIFMFTLYFFLFSLPLILWDSFYYGKLSWEDIRELNLSPESFVVTPANYFASKSSQFRDTWAYLKIFVMYILVFNVLGLMGLISFLKEIYDILFADWRFKPNLDSHWTFLNCSLFLPLFFLIQARGNSYSVFDLVPLVFPLVYMHGYKIPIVSRFSSKIGLFWFLSNILGILYFGYLSQGGILSSLLDLNDNLIPIRFNETQVDITFSQISAIPATFTLAIPSRWKTLVTTTTMSSSASSSNNNENSVGTDAHGFPSSLHKTVLKLESSSKIRVFHTGFSPLPMAHLERDLLRLVTNQEKLKKDKKDFRHKTSFLLIPYKYGRESEETFSKIKLTHVKTYWNHIHIPGIDDNTNLLGFNLGLKLYRMEKRQVDNSKMLSANTNNSNNNNNNNNNNATESEKQFRRYFQFHDDFYEFLKYIGNFLTLLLTGGIFVTSYLVFLT